MLPIKEARGYCMNLSMLYEFVVAADNCYCDCCWLKTWLKTATALVPGGDKHVCHWKLRWSLLKPAWSLLKAAWRYICVGDWYTAYAGDLYIECIVLPTEGPTLNYQLFHTTCTSCKFRLTTKKNHVANGSKDSVNDRGITYGYWTVGWVLQIIHLFVPVR